MRDDRGSVIAALLGVASLALLLCGFAWYVAAVMQGAGVGQ